MLPPMPSATAPASQLTTAPRPRGVLFVAAFALAVAALCGGCSSGDDDKRERDAKGSREDDEPRGTDKPDPLGGPPAPTPPPMSTVGGPDDEAKKLVYLMSRDDQLYSFDPRIPGRAAYRGVGKVDCKAAGTPQSMAVDWQGFAWVFYDSGQLFKVSVRDAHCSAQTPYKHPSFNRQLGMGFTSVAPGSSDERLYILSPDFGLATISTKDFGVSTTGMLANGAELTGGGDGKLFYFAAWERTLSEIDLATKQLRLMHSFAGFGNVGAWAFARYKGRFYMFTSTGFSPSRTTEYDPKTNREITRDEDIGFVVVGAGQSTLAPPPDSSGDLSGDFPTAPPP